MNKSMTYAAIAILILAMTFSLVASPANAQPGTTRKTYAIVDVNPNPSGVGEAALVRFGIMQQLPSVENGYSGITVTVVKPDNTTETLGPFTTDSTGESYTMYTPATVGTYKFTSHFPEQIWVWGDFFNLEGSNMIFNGTTMAASTSATVSLVVTSTPRQLRPDAPLPTEYWTRPIDDQLRTWYQVSGNWPTRPDNNLALYNDYAPETAHVLWVKPLTTGGLTGGLWGDGQVPAASYTGDAYEGKFPGSVIMNGVLFYNKDTQATYSGRNGIVAVDLHTGKVLWEKNNTYLSFGQTLYFNSWNVDGVYNYLWDTSNGNWTAYDPFTGDWVYTMYSVPSGMARTYGPSGEILIWQLDLTNGWMALWNSTKAGQNSPNFYEAGSMLGNQGSWASYMRALVHGETFNASEPGSWSWNVTIPAGLQTGSSFFAPVLKVYPDRVVGIWWDYTKVRVWALSTLPASRGTLLFDKTWNAPAEWLAGVDTIQYASATNQVAKGVIAVWNKELTKFYGFSVETGNYMWETASENVWDFLGWGNAEHTWDFAYGHLYSVGVGGIVYAYNDQTGATDWTYTMSDPYNEPVTGNNWWGWITVITDGKVYVGTVEHSAENPLPRGGPYICLNASNGAELWRVNGMFRATRWGGNSVIGDSIIATMDTYDQNIYAIGKGPSATTIMASPKVSAFTDGVLIEGYVTDTSPGTEEYARTARFPNGVPAVSDPSMSDWMLYVYKQFARPANATGVDVSISVFDANNNYRTIGTTKTDANGFYSFNWHPDISGKFNVYASFAGSNAYYASFAETAFAVNPAPEPTQAPTPAPTSLADQYLLPATGGIIAAIAIVGIVLALLLRRK
jgi:hypothetical protein